MDTKYVNYRVMAEVARTMEEAATDLNHAAGVLTRQVNAGPFGRHVAESVAVLVSQTVDLAVQLWMAATLVRLVLAKYLHGEYKSAKSLNDLRLWMEAR